MIFRDLYYWLKPFIPRQLQINLRRLVAASKRKAYARVWPIDPDAGGSPPGWKGWPAGYDFALVLIHDVDTLRGAERCVGLMDLERGLGFRSAFNFVPERYTLDPSIRAQIAEAGFEIGVHGLKHDGRLFKRRSIFDKRALKINSYLSAWNAVGFSTPSMLSNLEWIAELNVEYSCSTFDTDPFEPQNDATKRIFPSVAYDGTRQRSYIEMPYTLAQDHCLFIILGERSIDIWVKKLRWVAEHHGVALLVSHPDYMGFNGANRSLEEYPVELYARFLEHIRQEYEGRYWHPLPRELARFWKSKATNGPSS